MMLRSAVSSIALLLSAVCFSASAADLTGVVFNIKNKPIKEVRIWKKNTKEVIKTSDDGRFEIPLAIPSDTIVVAVNDKFDAVFPVGQLRDIKVILDKKFYVLDDGSQRVKRDYQRVDKNKYDPNVLVREQIIRKNVSSIYELLRGSISGVNVTYGDSGQKISIRGGNSLELDSEPLFIVDGTMFESSAEVDAVISIDDIMRVEVSKDGSAYGMKGSNGAIIITTLNM